MFPFVLKFSRCPKVLWVARPIPSPSRAAFPQISAPDWAPDSCEEAPTPATDFASEFNTTTDSSSEADVGWDNVLTHRCLPAQASNILREENRAKTRKV